MGMNDLVERLRAWLVTGPLGRGLSFVIDFAVALRTMLAQRR
jgi:transketolase